jgi:hypothetical protein
MSMSHPPVKYYWTLWYIAAVVTLLLFLTLAGWL